MPHPSPTLWRGFEPCTLQHHSAKNLSVLISLAGEWEWYGKVLEVSGIHNLASFAWPAVALAQPVETFALCIKKCIYGQERESREIYQIHLASAADTQPIWQGDTSLQTEIWCVYKPWTHFAPVCPGISDLLTFPAEQCQEGAVTPVLFLGEIPCAQGSTTAFGHSVYVAKGKAWVYCSMSGFKFCFASMRWCHIDIKAAFAL